MKYDIIAQMKTVPPDWVNLTALTQAKGKHIADFLRLSQTKNFLAQIEQESGFPQVVIRKGGNYKQEQGTWGSPKVASELKRWIRLERKIQTESEGRDKFVQKFPNAQVEVYTPAGRCDVFTGDFAVEVKHARRWQAAVGQALAYAYYLKAKPAIHLYKGEIPFSCIEVCRYLGVEILP